MFPVGHTLRPLAQLLNVNSACLAKELTLALPAKQMPRRGRKGNRKSGSGWQKGAAWAGQLVRPPQRFQGSHGSFSSRRQSRLCPTPYPVPPPSPHFSLGENRARVLLNRGTSFQSSGPRPGEDSGPGLPRTGPVFLIVLLSEFPLGVRGSFSVTLCPTSSPTPRPTQHSRNTQTMGVAHFLGCSHPHLFPL